MRCHLAAPRGRWPRPAPPLCLPLGAPGGPRMDPQPPPARAHAETPPALPEGLVPVLHPPGWAAWRGGQGVSFGRGKGGGGGSRSGGEMLSGGGAPCLPPSSFATKWVAERRTWGEFTCGQAGPSCPTSLGRDAKVTHLLYGGKGACCRARNPFPSNLASHGMETSVLLADAISLSYLIYHLLYYMCISYLRYLYVSYIYIYLQDVQYIINVDKHTVYI